MEHVAWNDLGFRKFEHVGKFVFGMTASLDGYVAGVDGELEPPLYAPDMTLFRYWVDSVRDLAGNR